MKLIILTLFAFMLSCSTTKKSDSVAAQIKGKKIIFVSTGQTSNQKVANVNGQIVDYQSAVLYRYSVYRTGCDRIDVRGAGIHGNEFYRRTDRVDHGAGDGRCRALVLALYVRDLSFVLQDQR